MKGKRYTEEQIVRVMRDMAASPGAMVAASAGFTIQDILMREKFRLFLDNSAGGGGYTLPATQATT